jgi:hypothetical protein
LYCLVHTSAKLLIYPAIHYVCIGGLEEDRRPILTFPEVGLKYLENPSGFKELATSLLYFKTLTWYDNYHYHYPNESAYENQLLLYMILCEYYARNSVI